MTRRFEIVWSDNAKNQLFEIADVIAADKPRAAEKWLQTVLKKIENASKMPLAFRKVPELDAENIREVIVGAKPRLGQTIIAVLIHRAAQNLQGHWRVGGNLQ